MVSIRKFRREVQKRATSESRSADVGRDPVDMGCQFRVWPASITRRDNVPMPPKLAVIVPQEGHDQVILGREPPIDTGLGDAGHLNDRIDADRAAALATKHVLCRPE